jgi:hypothetical protein
MRPSGWWRGLLGLGEKKPNQDEDPVEEDSKATQEALHCLDSVIAKLSEGPTEAEALWGNWGAVASQRAHTLEASSQVEGISRATLRIQSDNQQVVSLTLHFGEDSGIRFSALESRMAERLPAPPPSRPDSCTHHFRVKGSETHPIQLKAQVQTKPGRNATKRAPVLWVRLYPAD